MFTWYVATLPRASVCHRSLVCAHYSYIAQEAKGHHWGLSTVPSLVNLLFIV